RVGQPLHPGLDGEEAAGLRLRRARLRAESDRGRSDEHDVEAGAAEHRTGRLRNRQHDRPGDATRGIVADDAPASPVRDPHEPLAVDGGPSGTPSAAAIRTKTRRLSISPVAGSKFHAQTVRCPLSAKYITRLSGLQHSALEQMMPS